MTSRLGIHIERSSLRAVLMRSKQVVAAWERERDATHSLGDDLRVLFASLPSSGWRQPTTAIVIGPHACRTKKLSGLPPLEPADLDRLIRESSDRFFVGDPGSRFVAARASRQAVMAETYDRDLVRQSADAAQEQGITRLTVMSVPTAVASLVQTGTACVETDGFTLRVICEGGHVCDLGRGSAEDARLDLGDQAGARLIESAGAQFLIAYAGASATSASPVIEPLAGKKANATRWRSRAAIVSAVIAGILLLLSPTIAARREGAAAERELRELSAAYRDAASIRLEIASVTAGINAIAQFQSSIRSSHALAAITRGLPRSAALVAFAMDSAGGSLVAVGDRAVEILAALEAVRDIALPQISGPITRERIEARELERVTIRFAWSSRP